MNSRQLQGHPTKPNIRAISRMSDENEAQLKFDEALVEVTNNYSWAAVERLGDAERELADIRRARTEAVKLLLEKEVSRRF